MAYASPISATLKSMMGKAFGTDRTRSERPYALNDFRMPVTTITTASTNVTNNGLASVSSSSGAWTVDAPEPGVAKRFFATSTSTLSRVFTLASGNFEVGIYNSTANVASTAGSSFTTFTFVAQGQWVNAIGISTAKYAVLGFGGFSTAAVAFSTV